MSRDTGTRDVSVNTLSRSGEIANDGETKKQKRNARTDSKGSSMSNGFHAEFLSFNIGDNQARPSRATGQQLGTSGCFKSK